MSTRHHHKISLNVISTFAGGGSSTGYRLAGGKILCINEFVEEAQNTYKENYPDTPILLVTLRNSQRKILQTLQELQTLTY